MNLNIYTKSELLEIYNFLKKYKNLKKTVGKKSTIIATEKLYGKEKIRVDYFPSVEIKSIENEVICIYKQIFSISVSGENIDWIKNDKLNGGIRVFYGDDMVDISFENVANILKGI